MYIITHYNIVQRLQCRLNRITNSPHRHRGGEAVNWYNDLPAVSAESVENFFSVSLRPSSSNLRRRTATVQLVSQYDIRHALPRIGNDFFFTPTRRRFREQPNDFDKCFEELILWHCSLYAPPSYLLVSYAKNVVYTVNSTTANVITFRLLIDAITAYPI